MSKYMNMILKWTENSQKILSWRALINTSLHNGKKSSYIWSLHFQIIFDKDKIETEDVLVSLEALIRRTARHYMLLNAKQYSWG